MAKRSRRVHSNSFGILPFLHLDFLYGCAIILRTLISGIDVPGYASLFVAVLMLGSLQMVSIGILGEYLGRVYLETKQRPAYIVRREYGAGRCQGGSEGRTPTGSWWQTRCRTNASRTPRKRLPHAGRKPRQPNKNRPAVAFLLTMRKRSRIQEGVKA